MILGPLPSSEPKWEHGPLTVLLDLSILSTQTLSRGLGRYVESLALELHRRAQTEPGLRVFALAEKPLFGAPRVSDDLPSLVKDLSHRRKKQGPPARGGNRALARAIAMSGADVVHFLDPQAMATRHLTAPSVITCHHVESKAEVSEWHGTRAKVRRADVKRYTGADRIIAISRATAHELITRMDIPRDKISIVHHGVSMAKWAADNVDDPAARLSALGIGKRPYLLCVGAVEERKNVDAVFQGLSRARRMIGNEDLAVVWAGRLDKAEQQKLLNRARDAGVLDAVVLVGYVSDRNLAALYRAATALVFASKREGFGYPVVEAMAGGCPVVTSNCSSLIEVAEGAALTVDPDDTDAIADAIVLLADDNAERHRLGRMGRDRAAAFSLRDMVDGTLAVYRQVAREVPKKHS